MKSTKCHECGCPNRAHALWCISRGYAAVGPHPDAPSAEPPKPTVILSCPCGIARLDCDYHRPGADSAPATDIPDRPWCEITVSNGQKFAVYGTHSEVFDKLLSGEPLTAVGEINSVEIYVTVDL